MADDSDSNDALGSKLLDLGRQVDSGLMGLHEEFDRAILGDAQPTEDEATVPDGDAAEAARQPAETPEATTEEATPESSPKEGETKEADPKEDSKYAKALKDKQRLEINWKKFQEEKTAFLAEKAAFEARAQQTSNTEHRTSNIEGGAQALAASSAKDAHGYTSADYEAAAEDFEAEGETELAERARTQAQALKAGEATAQKERQQAEFTQTWQSTCAETCKAIPELLNLESPIAKEVGELLKSERIFSTIPDGFRKAAEIAQLRLEAGSVPGLKQQLAEMSRKLEAANGKLTIGGSNPVKPAGSTPPAHTADSLLALAAEVDARGF